MRRDELAWVRRANPTVELSQRLPASGRCTDAPRDHRGPTAHYWIGL